MLYDEILNLNESLKGTRVKNGELFIKGFTYEEYEDLYFYIMETLKPYYKNNFDTWYKKTVNQYTKFRKRTNKNNNVFVPQNITDISEHTLREQLAVFKFFIYRRANAKYKTKEEEE